MGEEHKEFSPSRNAGETCAATPKSAATEAKYRGWTISYDPPPIPVRDMDWHFIHPDFDASWEGEEDGYVSNGLAGYGASVEDCKAQIDDIEEGRQ